MRIINRQLLTGYISTRDICMLKSGMIAKLVIIFVHHFQLKWSTNKANEYLPSASINCNTIYHNRPDKLRH